MSAGVFTLVDFYLHFDGPQPAFEEAQQQAAAAGGHYASEAQATPRVDVGDLPEASSLQSATIMEQMHANMQLFVTVQSLSLALVACTSRNCVCVDNSWWQLVRAFLGIVEKWFWRLPVGAMRTLNWGENVDMLRLRSKSPKFWPKTLGTDTSTVTISPDF